MANIALVGQTQAEIDHVFAITATKVSVNGDRPVTVKYGPQGAIGTSKGAEKVTASLTFAVPLTGLEFDLIGLLAKPLGFTFSFPIGAEKHSLYGCQITKRAFSNDPESGSTEISVDITATEWIRTR